jgi:nitrous oxide reductase accessory protein NosL
MIIVLTFHWCAATIACSFLVCVTFAVQESDQVIYVQDIWNTTWYPKAADHVTTEKTWYVVDAEDKILGRMASAIAVHMRGKNEPTYTPSVDMGAFVIVVCVFSCGIYRIQ